MKEYKNKKISKLKKPLLLVFRPFIQITNKRVLLLGFKKEAKDAEIEWSLDCSGQGECQPNVSPSDGDEKMDFLNESMNLKNKK